MAVKPISPQEALDLKITNISDLVIQTVNSTHATSSTTSSSTRSKNESMGFFAIFETTGF